MPDFGLVAAVASTKKQKDPLQNSTGNEFFVLRSCADFQQPQQPCSGRSKPSCCVCSQPPKMPCCQHLGWHCARLHVSVLLLTPTAAVHKFTGCLWRKLYQNFRKKSPWHLGETCGSRTTACGLLLCSRRDQTF
jgi:hypothetical protein